MADAAVALICERGAAATTLSDIGVLAGYSRGLASYRFGSKAGCGHSSLEQSARRG